MHPIHSMQPPSTKRSDSAPPASQPERRAFRRAPFARPVLIETAQRSITARGIDVSGGGIAIHTDAQLDATERVSVYFELPIGYAFESTAELTRRDGDVIVLRFVDAPKEGLLAVRSFCRISGLMPAVYGPAASGAEGPRRLRSV